MEGFIFAVLLAGTFFAGLHFDKVLKFIEELFEN